MASELGSKKCQTFNSETEVLRRPITLTQKIIHANYQVKRLKLQVICLQILSTCNEFKEKNYSVQLLKKNQ